MFVVFLYFLHALSHSQGFKAIAKRKENSMSFLENLTYTKRKFYFGVRSKITILCDYPSFASFIVTFASFLRISSTSLRAFPPLVFLASRLCKSCSFLDWSFSRLQFPWIWFTSRLIPFGFWELNFSNVLLSFPLFFCFWKFSSQCRH